VTPSPALSRVARGDLCAGCGACAAIAPGRIAMRLQDGWLRPAQTGAVTAEEDARIARACPGLTLTLDAAGRTDDPLWGPLVAVRTGWSTDPALRAHASSGGALSAVLIHLLRTGAVERVIQTAADPANPLGNVTVLSGAPEAVAAAAGSRYAPSAPLADLPALLGTDLRYAFVGKPCDVAALRALAAEDPRVDARIPYMLSFFCAGVPSLRGAEAILTALGVERAQVAAFRYRGDGWPGQAKATLKDGTARGMSYADSWGGILSKHTQLRCRICPDGVGSFADLVCADAWECDDKGYPLFEEAEGRSLIVTRTAKGEALAQAAMAAGALAAQPFDAAAIGPMQPGQLNRKRVALARIAALATLGRPVPRFSGLRLGAAARRARPAALLRNFLGTITRRLRTRRG
jgi:coenzyme F420 hydrogenase subunit beta